MLPPAWTVALLITVKLSSSPTSLETISELSEPTKRELTETAEEEPELDGKP
jgi:hypothetical protein